jgi:hypothetical protein
MGDVSVRHSRKQGAAAAAPRTKLDEFLLQQKEGCKNASDFWAKTNNVVVGQNWQVTVSYIDDSNKARRRKTQHSLARARKGRKNLLERAGARERRQSLLCYIRI